MELRPTELRGLVFRLCITRTARKWIDFGRASFGVCKRGLSGRMTKMRHILYVRFRHFAAKNASHYLYTFQEQEEETMVSCANYCAYCRIVDRVRTKMGSREDLRSRAPRP
jgi:hypothetical protein